MENSPQPTPQQSGSPWAPEAPKERLIDGVSHVDGGEVRPLYEGLNGPVFKDLMPDGRLTWSAERTNREALDGDAERRGPAPRTPLWHGLKVEQQFVMSTAPEEDGQGPAQGSLFGTRVKFVEE